MTMECSYYPYYQQNDIFLDWEKNAFPLLDIGIRFSYNGASEIIKAPSDISYNVGLDLSRIQNAEVCLFRRGSTCIFKCVAKVLDVTGVLQQIGYGSDLHNQNHSISYEIAHHTNDYSLYDYCCRILGLNSIVFGTAPHLRQYPSISVIIPGYGVHGTIDGVVDSLIRSFDYCHLDKWEVIVVDDANEVPLVPCDERVKTIRTNHRVYSAGARNIGIIHSRGDIVVFLDGDTYVAPNYIQESIFRNMIVPNLITVCMRESIDEFEQVPNRLPNTTEDTRYKAVYSPERIGSTLVTKPITVMALKETENFKNFGFGRMLGPADLAFMVKGNNICVSRDMANVMFPPGFIGYGPEDVTFSAKLIARGCKVVPVLSSGVFHRKHPLRSGSTRQRDDELRKNIGKQKECLGQNTWEEWINE